ncbi:MAG: 2-hydroxyacid dehydrogenase [Gammaproteobacteria bacterium]|jgi:glycerate dehydrogenase
MKAVFLDFKSVDAGDLDLTLLRQSHDDWTLHDETVRAETAGRIGQAGIVVSNKVQIDRTLIENSPELRLICVAATGTNNVDLEAAKERGIPVTNVTAYGTPSVVQHVFALMFALATHLQDYTRLVAEGDWQQSSQFCLLDFPIMELAGKTLGIIGYGELGRGVAQAAEAFGMRVLIAERRGAEPRPGRVPLDELLAVSDVVTLHVPLTPETRNLVDARALEQMKPSALLINAARGGVVDEQALADALRAGRIGGAGVDVLTCEPPADGNPLLAPDIPNLIVTPHIAWASRESRQRLLDDIATTIAEWHAGHLRSRVV